MSEPTPFIFANQQQEAPNSGPVTWKIFIVDDDKDIHTITKLALKDLSFKGKLISFESAYSAKEAISILRNDSDFSIVLLDIGMETADAGLEVAKYIRKELHNTLTRIIIRTGQPGDVPEREIIDDYDINDYKSKTELTIEKLFTVIRTAIAQYDQINDLAILNHELEDRVAKAVKKQQEQQEKLFLQSRSIQMNELLSMIAHQWRQPLSCITSVVAQLKLGIILDDINSDKFSNHLDDIEKYTVDLSQTIDEFRMMYEPSQRTASISIRELLNKSAGIITTSFQEQNISISINGDDNALNAKVSGELYQVVLNILKNAQEAFLEMKIAPALIEIKVSEQDNQLLITIKDNAGGIDKETLGYIFDPYFSTKDNKNGHGLGLHISKNIVEQQCHGRLSAEVINAGTCFTIIIDKT